MTLPSSATLNDINTAINNLTGINQVSNLASVLSNWGVSLTGSETMQDLVDKINGITQSTPLLDDIIANYTVGGTSSLAIGDPVQILSNGKVKTTAMNITENTALSYASASNLNATEVSSGIVLFPLLVSAVPIVKLYQLDDNGNMTEKSSLAMDTAGAAPYLVKIKDNLALAVWNNGTKMNYCTISVSGTTMTKNTVLQIETSSNANVSLNVTDIAVFDETCAMIAAYGGTSAYCSLHYITLSGTTVVSSSIMSQYSFGDYCFDSKLAIMDRGNRYAIYTRGHFENSVGYYYYLYKVRIYNGTIQVQQLYVSSSSYRPFDAVGINLGLNKAVMLIADAYNGIIGYYFSGNWDLVTYNNVNYTSSTGGTSTQARKLSAVAINDNVIGWILNMNNSPYSYIYGYCEVSTGGLNYPQGIVITSTNWTPTGATQTLEMIKSELGFAKAFTRIYTGTENNIVHWTINFLNPQGIALTAGSVGSTVQVQSSGVAKNIPTTLVPGTDYYLDLNGKLATATNNLKLGVALSSSDMLIL